MYTLSCGDLSSNSERREYDSCQHSQHESEQCTKQVGEKAAMSTQRHDNYWGRYRDNQEREAGKPGESSAAASDQAPFPECNANSENDKEI